MIKAFSQNENASLNNSEEISVFELIRLADKVDFDENLSSVICIEKENTYYAVRKSCLESRFVELRLIELIDKHSEIIHVGLDDQSDFFFFSVNTEYEKRKKETARTLYKYISIARNAKESLTLDQIEDWVECRDNPSKFK